MPPHEGLVHPKEYDWRDSNVEAIGSELDHKVKYNSAAAEPAWQAPGVGTQAGLWVWRIEQFEVVAWPRDRHGDFYEGDSYIVLHSYRLGSDGDDSDKLGHDIFFWLGATTTQDEAGTAAYKTVELDERLAGAATQHRELQREPSDDFVALFPRIRILSGGAASGFRHVEAGSSSSYNSRAGPTLLRIFRHPSSAARRADTILVHEVPADWRSLDDGDVFVLDCPPPSEEGGADGGSGGGDLGKIWVWQGARCSPMEKAKAAQVVHDMTAAGPWARADVEVLTQTESRSRAVPRMLGAQGPEEEAGPFRAARPLGSSSSGGAGGSDHYNDKNNGSNPPRPRRLFRLSDASGQLRFTIVRDGGAMSRAQDLDGADVFLLDTGRDIWVWQGSRASRAERAMWIRVAESYISNIGGGGDGGRDGGASGGGAHLSPISKVNEGFESPAFVRALEA